MARMGEIIDGKYEVLREIGRGGMSVVYLAMDRRLNKQWAIKEFRKDKDDANKQVALKALLDEANLMKKFDHPTLPRIVDIIEEPATVYVVMDYIEGESLNKVLDAYGAQPQEAVIEWAKQLSEVLDYLHTQNPPVIYRDMKPANIMLKPDGTVRLIDFGIAREWKEGKEGDTEAIGTRGYAAPEQFGGRGQTDARTDIYSLGVTLYHLVTGKNPAEPPYEIYPIRHWDSSLSSGLEWMIQKCTQLNPNDRYQSCAEITYVLENLDKFETEYKKKLKGKINLFVTMAALTLVFTIASVGSLVGASTIKKNTYANLISAKNYTAAIEQDEVNPEAYVDLVDELAERITVIYAKTPDGKLQNNETTDEYIGKWFTYERLEKLKEKYPDEYTYIQYKLGYLYWNFFKSAEEGGADGAVSELENVTESKDYFREVVLNPQSESVDAKVELTDGQLNIADNYYMVSFFVGTNLDNEEEGSVKITDEAAQEIGIYGIDEKNCLQNPYYSYWQTNKELLNSLLDEEQDVTSLVKIRTLKKIIYIVGSNQENFLYKTRNKDESVTGDEMEAVISDIKKVLENVSAETVGEDETSNIKVEIKEAKESLNLYIGVINSTYDLNMEVVE